MDKMDGNPDQALLSERELEIVRLLAEGLTNREIGDKLFLSLETIKWYNKQIYQKLAVTNRSQAVSRARALGLFLDDGSIEANEKTPSLRIPPTLTSFIGREQETDELLDLLEHSRLVTITGPGGSGKTRLSLHVAERLGAQFASGVIFIGLAATRDPRQVASTLAQEFGVVEQADQPVVESIQNYLARKEMLLILDNFEHLLPAAPLVNTLLAAAPQLTVLATSRELLHLSGESEYPLYPLDLPTADQTTAASLETFAVVALFSQRAQAASRRFALTDDNAAAVAAICQRLDGLPLAIELAAAWIKIFTPEQLLERLDSRLALLKGGPQDLPDRQRTLRGTLEWGYQLLSKDEQTFFNRLAVFVGGRTLEAIDAICTPGLPIETIAVVSALFDKSFLNQEQGPEKEPRFIMLETIHEYAWEKLQASGEARSLRDRHLEYFLGLAEEFGLGYRRQDQLRLLEQTAVEMNNLRAAFAWAMETEKYELAARMASALDYYLYYKGSSVEGYDWFQQVLPFAESIPVDYRIKFLISAGRLAWVNNKLAIAEKSLQRSLELSLEIGDELGQAWSLIHLGGNQFNTRSYEDNLALANHAQLIFERHDHLPGLAQTLNIQGELARQIGNTELARQNYEASLAFCRKTGEVYRQMMIQSNLSFTLYLEGDFPQALDYAQDTLRDWIKADNRQGMISQLATIAGPLTKLGEPVKAARLLAASQVLYDEMGAGHHPSDFVQIASYKADVKQQLGEEGFATAWAEGSPMTLREAVAYALEE